MFVVCCTLAWKLSDHPCIFVDTKGRTFLNRKVPVPLNGTTPVEEEQEDDQGKRDGAKDANDLDNQMLALIGHPAHPLARDALAREELDGRQSVVENQQADLDKPDGPQRTELHGEHHLAAINRPLRLQGREFGDVFCGHVVAAIFGRRVDADHVGREESLPDEAVSINWKIGRWGGGGSLLTVTTIINQSSICKLDQLRNFIRRDILQWHPRGNRQSVPRQADGKPAGCQNPSQGAAYIRQATSTIPTDQSVHVSISRLSTNSGMAETVVGSSAETWRRDHV